MTAPVVATGRAKTGGPVFVCFSRCLYCGRQTPHEVCHLHSRAVGHNRLGAITPSVAARLDAISDEDKRMAAWGNHFTTAMNRAWRRHFNREPEECVDPECPQAKVDWQ